MIFLIGGNGFVGSAFARACAAAGREHVVITRQNYQDYRGKACSILVNANGNSKKYLSKDRPLDDFDLSVRSVRASLLDFRYDCYVHLSSCDVYPDCSDPAATAEDAPIDVARQSPYGFHKYLAEQCVRHVARRHLIFRMGGFVGPGLKKNAVFDVLAGGPLWLDPESELQFIHTDRLAEVVLGLAQAGVANDTFNICGRGTVRLSKVVRLVGRDVVVQPGAPRVRYEIDLGKISRHVCLPDTEPAVCAFVLGQLESGRHSPKAA
jgi:nucleoside-diphosphate-sugar epimerase